MRKPVMAGEEGKPLRTNADGVGAWVRLHAGPLRTAAENTTLFAGLGQSRLPLHFGLGKADAAEAVRVRWPDAVVQAELNQAAGVVTIVELNRKPSSCPMLFTWDGERFVYVTDFLGAGSVGETGPDGSVRPPRPEESVKIEPDQLAPRNGKYVLKVAEPMDEVMYLDRLRLDVIDHPADVSVFPDERFATSDPQPTQELLFFRDSERVFAAKATDHRGRDVTATLRDRDGKPRRRLRPALVARLRGGSLRRTRLRRSTEVAPARAERSASSSRGGPITRSPSRSTPRRRPACRRSRRCWSRSSRTARGRRSASSASPPD